MEYKFNPWVFGLVVVLWSSLLVVMINYGETAEVKPIEYGIVGLILVITGFVLMDWNTMDKLMIERKWEDLANTGQQFFVDLFGDYLELSEKQAVLLGKFTATLQALLNAKATISEQEKVIKDLENAMGLLCFENEALRVQQNLNGDPEPGPEAPEEIVSIEQTDEILEFLNQMPFFITNGPPEVEDEG